MILSSVKKTSVSQRAIRAHSSPWCWLETHTGGQRRPKRLGLGEGVKKAEYHKFLEWSSAQWKILAGLAASFYMNFEVLKLHARRT